MLNQTPVPEEASTLFLGDLSVFCTEKDIRKLFRPFGPIEAIRVKRGSSNKTNLSYGFIKFTLPESAEQAMKQLNGVMFLGRALRIGWAEGKNPHRAAHPREEKKIESAQVHVSFISKQVDVLISEATLRGLFSLYGEVIDVALKKSQFDRNLKIQNGYGFVHYPLTPEGIRSAVTAVQSLHQVTIDRVTYDCSVSHALEDVLGPTTIEDHPGAVPLNDRGFCLPLNVSPMPPTTATVPPRTINNLTGNDRRNNNRQGYDHNRNQMLEAPLPTANISFQDLNPSYPGYMKPNQIQVPYNMSRPMMPPPNAMFSPAPLVFPDPNQLSGASYVPALPMPPTQPMYAPMPSSDMFDSLLSATERLTINNPSDLNNLNTMYHNGKSNSQIGYATVNNTTMPTMNPYYSTNTTAVPANTTAYQVPPGYPTNPAVMNMKNYYF